MGITGLIPFLEKASRRANVDEFSGCTVAIDSYCWLHKGAFACADKLVRGEDTDIHIKYCLKYVTMLLSKNIKPILVFDGRHLPAKAMTESKRRESRDISKKRAAELLSLGKIEEARSYMRRSVDITHSMALKLIKECRKRNVDCIVAPYEADSQLAYLNVKKFAHLVITEDSDLILFGCTKVLFKMDLDGSGTLVDTTKLPLVMKCPIENYTFDKFRQMCIMSGCDYLASLPGIGLAKARQFITATQDPNIANALRKLPSYFNKASLTVTDEYRESFLKAEATFKHQYVYDPLQRKMVRLTEPDDDDVETALCVNAGELLDETTAFQLALGNIDPFSLKKMDDWHPDDRKDNGSIKTDSWKEVAKHPSIWSKDFSLHLDDPCPWQKKPRKVEPIIAAPQTRARTTVVNLVPKYVAETQDESLTIENLSTMYCVQPAAKKIKTDCDSQEAFSQNEHNLALGESEIIKNLPSTQNRSPILENKERSFKKCLKNGNIMKRLSKFTRTVLDEDNVVESKFFSPTSSVDLDNSVNEKDTSRNSIVIEESPEKVSRNPFKVKTVADINKTADVFNTQSEHNNAMQIDSQNEDLFDTELSSSQKENSPRKSPILEPSPRLKKPFRLTESDIVIENTYPLETLVTPVDSQISYGDSQESALPWNTKTSPKSNSQPFRNNGVKRPTCRVPGLKRTASLPTNQPTLLSKFGFQKKPILRR
ncbi:exonuclease 1 isoform X2 [Pectinophora gossypiella]|uniref:exonuclease 1 isoform X2 n=1 Tax=Pectinophora gossypiella TaxID=13191 RepID=UPI00214EF5D1|nr:exonuclease 1 isoform X2 [Pectinophora gossypiella]